MGKRRFIPLISGLMIMIVLASCGGSPSLPGDEDGYSIYYQSQSSYELRAVKRSVQESSTKEIASALWELMLQPPRHLQVISVVPESVALSEIRVVNRSLYFYFENDYNSLDRIRELLFRTAAVKTFTQIADVDSICFYVGGQPLTDASGTPVGKMVATDFVDMLSSNIDDMEYRKVILYFADETGTKLVAEERQAYYNNSFSVERYVVEQLIAGPETEGKRAVLPSDLRLLSASVKDRICYLNFDTVPWTGQLKVPDYITVYAVVNTLCELPNITRVQIGINGSSAISLNTISLSELFERNLDYVTGGDEK